ncbi:MAG: hypothetical protein J5685_03800 [Clostridiales bacterium]|nr:hypothetical protein [Clostridiales bacterium]
MDRKKVSKNIFRATSVASTVFSMILNFIMFSFDETVAVLYRSSWLALMSFYYLIIAFMRLSFLLRAGKGLLSRDRERAFLKNYRATGRLIVFMSVIMAMAVYYMVDNMVSHTYPGILIIFVGLYTLYKVIASSRNVFKAGKLDSVTALCIQRINNLDALVSVIVLESAVITKFSSFRNSFSQDFMLYSGWAICLIVFIMGITSIIQSYHRLKMLRMD